MESRLQQSKQKESGSQGFNGRASMEALQRLKEAGTKSRRELAAFYRDCERKRSPEYMKNLSRLSELTAKRRELAKKISSVESTAESASAQGSIADHESSSVSLSEELEQLDKEIDEVGRELEKDMPQGSLFLTLIFWDIYQEALTQRGIIAPGNYDAYTDADDLIRRCGVEDNERAKEQLRRGHAALHREGAACMAVEIYLDAVCVIYPDGAAKVIREDPELGF